MRRLLGFVIVGLLFAGTAAACSSDSDSDTDSTTTTPAADSGGGTTDTTAASGDSGGASAEVEQFCSDAEALGQQLQDAVNDPTSADVATITADASALSASAADLGTANPDDADRINECAQALQVTP